MRWQDIIDESEGFITNPFPASKFKDVMYHGSNVEGITTFKRSAAGLWFSDLPTWGKRIYGADAIIYPCYIDVHNPYYPSDEEIDEYYGEMDKLPPFFNELQKQGYDAYFQGGESGAVAVFAGAKIVNARTGDPM
jgi:hypothetical protein